MPYVVAVIYVGRTSSMLVLLYDSVVSTASSRVGVRDNSELAEAVLPALCPVLRIMPQKQRSRCPSFLVRTQLSLYLRFLVAAKKTGRPKGESCSFVFLLNKDSNRLVGIDSRSNSFRRQPVVHMIGPLLADPADTTGPSF
jgi:hypothetical protein